MAVDDKNASALNAITTLEDADTVLVVDATDSNTKQITKANFRIDMVGSDVIETDLDKLHSVTSTATELNLVDGFTGSTADLNVIAGADANSITPAKLSYLNDVTSDLQSQIDAKLASTSMTKRPYSFALSKILGGAVTTMDIANTDLFAYIGLGSASYYIPSNSLHVTVIKRVSVTKSGEDKSAVVGFTSAIFGGATYEMTSIDLSSLTASTTYDIYVTFDVLLK